MASKATPSPERYAEGAEVVRPPGPSGAQRCIVLGLMHTGTNYWQRTLECADHDHEGFTVPAVSFRGARRAPVFSLIPWKHMPIWIIPDWVWSVDFTFYVTTRNRKDWMNHKNFYNYDVDKQGYITMSNRKFVPNQKGREHVREWIKARVPRMRLSEYWDKYDSTAKSLAARGLVKLLPFTDIHPAKEARVWKQ